ncbi:hypothetical protein U1708_08000 [Sphingomonas sp. ZB1N12]
MSEPNFLSAAQFITALIAIAVALTGWVTLILTNRRMRAERAIPVIRKVKGWSAGGCEIVIENVGLGVAINVVVAFDDDAKVVAGGLRTGESVVARLPGVGCVAVRYRDAIGIERRIHAVIIASSDGPFIAPPERSGLAKRVLNRMGVLAAS